MQAAGRASAAMAGRVAITSSSPRMYNSRNAMPPATGARKLRRASASDVGVSRRSGLRR